MSHIFEDFVEFSNMKRANYIDELKEEAKKLPLSSIIEALDFDEIARDVARKNCNFEKGTPISFPIYPIICSFDISVYPGKTKLRRDNFEVREYIGKSAVDFYNTLFKKIEEAIEESRDVPF